MAQALVVVLVASRDQDHVRQRPYRDVGEGVGEVHSLDPKTGCTHWTYEAEAGVRTAIVVGPYDKADGSAGLAAYFGDMTANAYAIDANSGELIWRVELDAHPGAAITGPPAVYDGRVYVPIQGLNEEGSVVRVDGHDMQFRFGEH